MEQQAGKLGRAAEILERARELSKEERETFLRIACAGDDELRLEIESLIAAGEAQGQFLANPTHDAAETMTGPLESAGSVIDGYKLLQLIGEGGFGAVYLAEQREPIVRRVALKIIKLGMDTRRVIARFEAERQALAIMDHPNIAKVLGAGATPAGRPYFVMELVTGEPITGYCDRHGLSIDDRLRLFAQVCHAVQHAHQKRIIREEDPPKPSTRLSTHSPSPTGRGARAEGELSLASIAAHRHIEPARLSRVVRGDLDWIVMKCLEKNRSRRYETANSLALDIERHLTHEPVEAGPPSRLYRTRKFIRRHRAGTIGAALVSLAILLGLGGTTWGILWALDERDQANQHAQRADREATEARQSRDIAEQIVSFMNEMLQGVGPSVALGRDITVLREMMDGAARRIHDGELKRAPKAELRLRTAIGEIYCHLAAYDAAESMLRPAVALAESIHGRHHVQVANVLSRIARLDFLLGRPGVALDSAERALLIQQQATAGDSEGVALSLHDVGFYLLLLHRPNDALPKFEESLAMYERLFPGDHVAVATGLEKLGGCLEDLGRMDDALSKLSAALNMRKRMLPGNHPDIAASLNNVAHCLERMGRADEALPSFEAALEITRRLYSGDHPDVATALGNVAYCLTQLERDEDALPEYEESLGILQRLFPSDHPDVAWALTNLGQCLQNLGRADDASARFEAALAMYETLGAADAPVVAQALRGLAASQAALGRASDALPSFQAALAMRRRLDSGDNPDVAQSLCDLGYCLDQLGRTNDALPYYEEALQMYKRGYGRDHIDIAFALAELTGIHGRLGNLTEAVALADQSVAMYERLFHDGHPDTVRILKRLGVVLQNAGRPSEALPYYRRALELCRQMYDEPHWWTAIVLHHLADALRLQGALDDAEPMAVEALAMYRDHPDWTAHEYQHAASVVGHILIARGRAAEAADLVHEIIEVEQRREPPNPSGLSSTLAQFGLALLDLQTVEAAASAEPLLRQCLELRGPLFPDGHPQAWLRYNTMSMLGEAVARQSRFDEAEPLLMTGWEHLKSDPAVPSPESLGADRKREALERLVALYDAWTIADPGQDYAATAAAWRQRLAEYDAAHGNGGQ
jgi:tetratricopeptide (TPR) repeat protein